MSKRARRIVALVLLLAFAGWIIMTFLPKSPVAPKAMDTTPVIEEYEPKFKEEGALYFLTAEKDTISKLRIELAETAEEIEYGMMYRKSMDPNTGMLFLMGDDQPRSFWMKDTYVPLDIIYINSDKQVVSIQKNAEPLSMQSRPSGRPASKVLEVTGGYADQYGIDTTTMVIWERR